MWKDYLPTIRFRKTVETVEANLGHEKSRVAELRDLRRVDKLNIAALAEQVIISELGYGRGSVITHTTSNIPLTARSFSLSPTGAILVRCESLHADESGGVEKRYVTYQAIEMIDVAGG
jgi:hypothetical protein